jgi:hypothetical protein
MHRHRNVTAVNSIKVSPVEFPEKNFGANASFVEKGMRIENLYVCGASGYIFAMFSHIVIFWTDPADAQAADELIAGANKYLAGIPGVQHFHIGKMAASDRPVVEQTYQVGLNIVFVDRKTQDEYQAHPLHVEFVEKIFKKLCRKVVVYDFE